MSARTLRRWRAVFALLVAATPARAAWRAEVATDENSGVTIEISSPFEHSPPAGYMPMWVTIHNASGAPRTWTVVCDGTDRVVSNNVKQTGTESLRVENGQTARLSVLMAVHPWARGYYYSTSFVRVDGYAVADRQTSVPGVNATGKGVNTHAVGMSAALATPIWTTLTKLFTDAGNDLMGTPVDLDLLGSDWRALVGLDDLWLTDADYNALDASRRATVHDWVSHGGQLYVCAQTVDPSLRAALGLPETGDEADAGFGHVQILRWDGKPLDLATVEGKTIKSASERAELGSSRADWPMINEIGQIPLNAPFLIFFIAVFALVVGPLNLFVFAKASRRHRLFWTTPAISVAASLLLSGFIVLRDGFGGSGQRAMLCLLLPEQKKAVVLQEQVARTGVLLSRGFTTAEDLVLTAVPAEINGTTRSFERAGRNYSGDWFASRSVQAARAEAVVPSRAEVQLLNADAAHDGAPPVVTSTVPAAIREIRYRDPAGHFWVGENLRTGERITMHRFQGSSGVAPTPGQEDQPLPEIIGGSALAAQEIQRYASTPGCFVAYADEGPFFETLPSIRWTKQRAVFVGRFSAAR